VPIPDGLEESVRETEEKQVLHRLLAEVMIDAENRLLRKHLVQSFVERLCRGQIPAERFFDDDARVLRTARFRKTLHDAREHARRNGEIMDRARRRTKLLA
jgi:hypothetical protein